MKNKRKRKIQKKIKEKMTNKMKCHILKMLGRLTHRNQRNKAEKTE